MKHALLLVRRNATATPLTVETLRHKGFEPVVLSSLPDDGGARFRQMCAQLNVECAVSAGVTITRDDVEEILGRTPDCAFCLSLADSQRSLMAMANQYLGAPDVDPSALSRAVDKHTMRTSLSGIGLSRLLSLRLSDPHARALIETGEPFVVKPRSGAGSLCVGVVRSWAEARELQDAFDEGPGEEDMMAEYFEDNELIAESFFAGQELSLDVVRQDGRNAVVVDHEKTVLEFGGGTVLERGMASPVVGLTPSELDAARLLTDRVLEALGLSNGCYHVELRVNDACEAEIVEINPRIGGALIWDSIHRQYGRSMTEDWIDVLAGREVAPLPARRCGTYQQLAHADHDQPLMNADTSANLPEPAISRVRSPGERSIAHRESFSACALWTTELARHREEVAALMAEEYYSFRYLPGLSGRPVVLLLQPPDREALTAATGQDGVDVVVVLTDHDPVASHDEYLAVCDRIAAMVWVPSWEDADACLSLVRQACADSRISDVLAPQGLTWPVADQIRAEAGLAAAAHVLRSVA